MVDKVEMSDICNRILDRYIVVGLSSDYFSIEWGDGYVHLYPSNYDYSFELAVEQVYDVVCESRRIIGGDYIDFEMEECSMLGYIEVSIRVKEGVSMDSLEGLNRMLHWV